jgi:membrane associated rhomboid family serine protease
VAVACAYVGGTQVPSFTQRFVLKSSEPMFNVPLVVIATVAVLALVHALRMFVLTDAEDVQFLLTFAFIPARYDINLLPGGSLPGGFGADLWTFFTYAFLHADLLHIGLNLAWLLPFGTALARRFGAWRYVLFMLVMAAAGAFAHLISHPGAMVPMIGASAAISGAMAAAMRFVFQVGGPLGVWREGDGDAYRVPASPLLTTLRDPRFLLFLAVWIGLNALFGLGTVSIGGEAGQEIAWQAHLGGFFAGLLLFNAFDPVIPRVEPDTEANGGDSRLDAAPQRLNPPPPPEPRNDPKH